MIGYKLVDVDYKSHGCPDDLRETYKPGLFISAVPDPRHLAYPDGRLYFWDNLEYTRAFFRQHLDPAYGGWFRHMLECALAEPEDYGSPLVVAQGCLVLRELLP